MDNETKSKALPSKIGENTALMLFLIGSLSSILLFICSSWLPSTGLQSLAYLLIILAITSFTSFIHCRIKRNAEEEIIANSKITSRGSDIFNDLSTTQGDKNRSYTHFNKYFTPVITIALILLELLFAYILKGNLATEHESPLLSPRFHIGIILGMGIGAFIIFLLGKYSSGLAFAGKQKLLRAPSGVAIICAIFSLLTIVAFIISKIAVSNESSSWRNPDHLLLYAGIAIMVLFAVDHLGGILFSFYRPKRDNEESLPLYESRISSLFAQPEGLLKGVTELIDYQFGFKLSETGFYSFMVKAILPIIIFQIITLMVLSMIIVVPTGKRGFCEYWGAPKSELLKPGIHFKYPWPLEKVYFCPADLVFTFDVGTNSKSGGRVRLWNELNENSNLFLTAQNSVEKDLVEKGVPVVNLIATHVTVQFSVDNPQNYYYKHSSPNSILKMVAKSSLISYLAAHDGLELMTYGTRQMNESLQRILNLRSKEMELGIDIISVSVNTIQPPIDMQINLVKRFQKTMSESQRSRSMVFDAKKFRNEVIPSSKTEAEKILSEARTYSINKLLSSKAEVDVLKKKIELYETYGRLYTIPMYLSNLQNAIYNTKKIVLATDIDDQVFSLDLKSEFNPEMLDLVTPEMIEEKK